MVMCIIQQIACTGNSYGLSVMYAELIIIFGVSRVHASLVYACYIGTVNAGGRCCIVFTCEYYTRISNTGVQSSIHISLNVKSKALSH